VRTSEISVFLSCGIRNNRIVAAAGNNPEKEMAAAEELMRLGKMPTPEELRKECIDLMGSLAA